MEEAQAVKKAQEEDQEQEVEVEAEPDDPVLEPEAGHGMAGLHRVRSDSHR